MEDEWAGHLLRPGGGRHTPWLASAQDSWGWELGASWRALLLEGASVRARGGHVSGASLARCHLHQRKGPALRTQWESVKHRGGETARRCWLDSVLSWLCLKVLVPSLHFLPPVGWGRLGKPVWVKEGLLNSAPSRAFLEQRQLYYNVVLGVKDRVQNGCWNTKIWFLCPSSVAGFPWALSARLACRSWLMTLWPGANQLVFWHPTFL